MCIALPSPSPAPLTGEPCNPHVAQHCAMSGLQVMGASPGDTDRREDAPNCRDCVHISKIRAECTVDRAVCLQRIQSLQYPPSPASDATLRVLRSPSQSKCESVQTGTIHAARLGGPLQASAGREPRARVSHDPLEPGAPASQISLHSCGWTCRLATSVRRAVRLNCSPSRSVSTAPASAHTHHAAATSQGCMPHS